MPEPSVGEPREGGRRSGPGILVNSATNIAGQASIAALGAVGGVLSAKALGPEGVGVLVITFILADFGRPLTSFTHVPSILQVHRGRDPEAVFGTSLAVKLLLSTLFSLALLVLSPVLVEKFHLESAPYAVQLASLVVLLGSFFEVGSARL